MNLKHDLYITPLVSAALREGRPVVALDSTTLLHCTPRAQRALFALQLLTAVRDGGAIPALTAVVDGVLTIGVADDMLQALCRLETVEKVSRRDLPVFVATKKTGATTVAATLILASLAGIPVLATAGIGGVNPDSPAASDISADLYELRQSPVCVVCSGVKGQPSPGATLEYLETMGVPVLGLRTDCFPGFFCRETAYPVDYNAQTETEIARITKTKLNLGLRGGVLAAVPATQDIALAPADVAAWTAACVASAKQDGIRGKAYVPYYLSHMASLSGGATPEVLMQLTLQNARIAGRISEAYAKE